LRPFRFLHTADLHLGTPFQGVGKHVPARWLEQLRLASFDVFARIVDVAIREQVQFITIAGDLFDAAEVPMSVQFELHRGFSRLAEHGIRVFVCHGNHDPLAKTTPMQWPANVTVFDAAPQLLPHDYVVPSVQFEPSDGTLVQVSGFSYGSSAIYHSVAESFVRDGGSQFAIALYHGVVGAAGDHANYCATKLQTLVQRNFDFWGLGHIHKPNILQAEMPTILYPGNPQGRHIREDGARGVWVVDVNEAGCVTLRNIPTATMLWHNIRVDLEGTTSLDEVHRCVLDALKTVNTASGEGEAHIVRLTLVGSTPMHGHLTDVEELLPSLQDAVEYQALPVLIESLTVSTDPPLDVDTLEQSDEFIGEFLRLVSHMRADLPSTREKLLATLTDVYHARNQLSVAEMPDGEIQALLDDVVRLVLKHLTIEGVAG
jgi:DNA repair protein SbcD/Mre11